MGKIIKAVKPFIYQNNSNFKLAVYQNGKSVEARSLQYVHWRNIMSV